MKSENTYGLRPLWDASLEVYHEIARICDKHGLRYYATDGTALGAVRHKGFIPWDDDFDISMPRPDYEKFKKIAAQELPESLSFWDFRDNPKFIYLFGKVQCTNKDKVLALEKQLGTTLSNGLYIDIFPIDGYPMSKFAKIRIKLITTILQCIVRFRCMSFSQQSRKGSVVWLAGLAFSIVAPWLNQRKCLSICERYLLRYPFETSKFTGRSVYTLNVLARAPLKQETWGVGKDMEFDATYVRVPENVDAHLRNEFYKYDYMQLPPEKDRHPTHTGIDHFPWWLGLTK